MLRRMEAAGHLSSSIRVGELEIQPHGLVVAGGHPLAMTRCEHQLLLTLAENVGSVVSREQLYAAAWQADLRPGDRSVDVYVHKLRTKLATALPDRAYIHTHHGFGYRLWPERSQNFHDRDTGS
jgi:DNA-binding response OmpR family regulator